MLSDRLDLEKKFVLWLSALLLAGYLAYGLLTARGASFFATTAVMGVVATIASLIAHYMVFRPIRRLVVVAEAVGAGDFSQRVRLDRSDEIGCLARAMDTMCSQLEAGQAASELHIAALEELRHSDRIATLGRLASSVAHELGNPLNAIELRAELIQTSDRLSSEQTREHALAIMEQTRRMTRIIEEILSFARRHPARITRVDLESVLRKAIALSQHTSRRHGSRIAFQVPPHAIEIDGDADKLLQVFVNLLVNGAQAMTAGTLRVRLTHADASELGDRANGGPYACVEVSDTGHGIAPDALMKVFEPFFSTKVDMGGTGLGLSVAQGIAREHDGFITVESEEGAGSSFKVYLPTEHGSRNTDAS